MEAFRSRFEYVGRFFTAGGDRIPWFGADQISDFERQVREGSNADHDQELKIKKLSWALIHSKQEELIKREINMIEISSGNDRRILRPPEKLYLLAVGYYRLNDYAKSLQLVEECLQIEPGWRKALYLKNTLEEQVIKDEVIGICITAISAGLVVGTIASKVFQHWPAITSKVLEHWPAIASKVLQH